MTSFIKVVSDLAYGEAVPEYDEALAELVKACIEHGKKGTFTLTLTVTPEKKSGQVVIGDSYRVARPEADRMDTIFYVQRDGSIGRRDPRQPELPFREVRTDVDPETGEIEKGEDVG